jgi:SAM-dependent methyltransferase
MSTTLYEYEQEVAEDIAKDDYWAQTRQSILDAWVDDCDPDSILDVGCGSGYLANHLGADSSLVAGIDIDATSVSLAADRPNVDLAAVGDAEASPFRANTFDCILLGDVMEHFEQPRSLLEECRRSLRSDGTLIISVPAFRWLWGPHDEHNEHADRYAAARLDTIVDQAGLSLDEHRYTNFFPLPAYFVMQRVLKSGVPSGARGGHGTAVERIKGALIALERAIRFPLGITLLAKCSPT